MRIIQQASNDFTCRNNFTGMVLQCLGMQRTTCIYFFSYDKACHLSSFEAQKLLETLYLKFMFCHPHFNLLAEKKRNEISKGKLNMKKNPKKSKEEM